MRRSIPLLVAALVGVASLAAGCGGSAGVVPELTSFSQVAQRSANADTAKFTVSVDLTLPGTDKALSLEAEGAFDTPAQRSRVKVDLSSFAKLVGSLGKGIGGDLGSPDDWKLEALQDGQTAYIHFPLLAKQLPAGKTWIKGDARELSGAQSGQLSQFGSLAGTDPRDAFSLLKAVSGSIEAVGSDTLRGVETSHYRATVDTAKLEQLVPADKRQSLGGLDQAAAQSGLSTIPLEIWIDADQRVHKLVLDIDVKQPGTAAGLKASLVAEFFDYGEPLDLVLPPADQVADAATLQKTR